MGVIGCCCFGSFVGDIWFCYRRLDERWVVGVGAGFCGVLVGGCVLCWYCGVGVVCDWWCVWVVHCALVGLYRRLGCWLWW